MRWIWVCTSLVIVSADASVPPPKIDYHQHLLSPELATLIDVPPIDADKLVALLDSAGIRRALVLSVAYSWSKPSRHVPNDSVHVREENDWVASQVARYPDRLRGFCSVNPARSYALAEIERCAGNPMLHTGLKLHIGNSELDYHNADDIAKLRQVFRTANQKHMAIVIHMHASISQRLHYGRDEAQIFYDSVLSAAPDIPVQIAHLAGAGGYDSTTDGGLSVFVDAIARNDPRARNLWFDVTSVVRGTSPSSFQRIADRIRQLGLHRVLFGSDAAAGDNCRPRECWEDFRKLPLTDAEFTVIANNVAPYMR